MKLLLQIFLPIFLLVSCSKSPFSTLSENTVPMFGYDKFHSGSLKVNIPNPSQDLELNEKKAKGLSDAVEYMPIFLNTDDLKKEVQKRFEQQKANKILFFGAASGGLVAYDIEKEEILWKRGKKALLAAPVLDTDTGKIYYRTRHSPIFLPHEQEKSHVNIASVNIDGSDFRTSKIDYSSIFEYNDNKPFKYSNSALLLIDHHDKTYLLWGENGAQWYPGSDAFKKRKKERSGFVYSIQIDEDGHLTQKHNHFITSKLSDEWLSGSRTSIWNSGSGVSAIDGQIMAVTGNGISAPKKGAYGCAVLRIDLETMTLDTSKKDKAFYMIEPKGYNECYYYDRDLASSSIASVKLEDKTISSVTGKNGKLLVFDSYNLKGRSQKSLNDYTLSIGQQETSLYYGQPNIFSHQDGVSVITAGKTSRNSPPDENTLSTPQKIKELENITISDYEKTICRGAILKSQKNHLRNLTYYYSGRTRRDTVATHHQSSFAKTLLSPKAPPYIPGTDIETQGYWAPYKKLPTSFQVHTEKVQGHQLPKNFSWQTVVSAYDKRMNRYINALKETLRDVKRYIILEEEGYVIAPDKDALLCDDLDKKKYQLIYDYMPVTIEGHKVGEEQSGNWQVHRFDLNQNLKPQKKWKYTPPYKETTIPNSNVVTVYNQKGQGFVIVPVTDGAKGKVYFIDLQTGDLTTKKSFDGQVHFTMPLVTGDNLFIPTRMKGIQWFKFQ